MVQFSVVAVFTDKSARSDSLFDDLMIYYKALEDRFKKFELICVTGCSDCKFNNDLNIFGANLNNCIVLKSDKPSTKRCLRLGLGTAVYDYVILLNTDRDLVHIDLDYSLVESNLFVSAVSCALVDSNNTELENQCGVVFKNFYLKLVLDHINAKTASEFCMQINRLFYHIGKSYRINNKLSHFELYEATIPISGFAKLRLNAFLRSYKKAFPGTIFRESDKGSVAYD